MLVFMKEWIGSHYIHCHRQSWVFDDRSQRKSYQVENATPEYMAIHVEVPATRYQIISQHGSGARVIQVMLEMLREHKRPFLVTCYPPLLTLATKALIVDLHIPSFFRSYPQVSESHPNEGSYTVPPKDCVSICSNHKIDAEEKTSPRHAFKQFLLLLAGRRWRADRFTKRGWLEWIPFPCQLSAA